MLGAEGGVTTSQKDPKPHKGGIFLQTDVVLPACHSKHELKIDLRVNLAMDGKMPLLTELGNPFLADATNIPPLTGLRKWPASAKSD